MKRVFIDGNLKGTGAFGDELDQGSFVVLSDDVRSAKDDFFIEEEYRGKGIGMWAMKKFLEHKTIRVGC